MAIETPEQQTEVQELDRVTIRFAGDSGDGMQLTGTQFTRTSAMFGNDVSTLPDYPAEIRAPAGSLPGVSGFQLSFASGEIYTPGDQPDVLVAMNPAALKTNIGDLPAGGALIVNTDAFTQGNLNKAGYASNPLTDGSLKQYNVFEIPINTLNTRALEDLDMTSKQVDLTKNFFALGVMFWLYERTRSRRSAGSMPSSAPSRSSPRRTRGRSRRATPSAKRPRSSTRAIASSRPSSHPAPTATSPATRQPHSASWPPPSWPSASCSTAATRSRRRATSSTSSRPTRTSASRPSRPRTRSLPSAPRSARPTAERSA